MDQVQQTETQPAKPRRSRSGSETRRTATTLSLRLSADERERMDAAAAERGIGPSTLLRQVALSLLADAPALPRRRRQPAADPAELRRLLAELGKLGSNTNQIARHMNEAAKAGKTVAPRLALLERTQAEIAAMREHLVEALEP